MGSYRSQGGVIGRQNIATKSVARGIWDISSIYTSRLGDTFPVPHYAPTWSKAYSASDWNTSGSVTTSGNYIYISGASYDGGYKGWGSTGTANVGFKALRNSWNLDFRANRDGVNSSPFPSYALGLGHTYTTGSQIQSSGGDKSIFSLTIGNAYGLYFNVYNGNNTALYNSSNLDGSGIYAVATTRHRVSFNIGTRTLTYTFASAGGSLDSGTVLSSYQFSQGELDALQASYDLNYNLFFLGRGNNDGWYDISWYTV